MDAQRNSTVMAHPKGMSWEGLANLSSPIGFRRMLKSIGLIVMSGLAPITVRAATPALLQVDNQIVLPADGQVTATLTSTSAVCTGDFGLYSPQQNLIFPDYLYYRDFPVRVAGSYPQGTELVFYITPRSFCAGGPYLSSDPDRARVTHPTPTTWIIAWEDWNDKDFNDLIVEIEYQPAAVPFLDLPYEYSGSFVDESSDAERHGKVHAYFDHQYPTYFVPPNDPDYPNVVNFLGYDSTQTDPQPPYAVTYDGHDGFDFAIGAEAPVLAAASGVVTFAGEVSGYCWITGQEESALVIKIDHGNGYVSEYWHLSSIEPGVTPGSDVTRDSIQPIGRSGNTGCSRAPHLHFKVTNAAGIAVDPYGWAPLPDADWFQQADPWQQYHNERSGADASSHYLWIRELAAEALLSRAEPTILTAPSQTVVAAFPAGAYAAPLRVMIAEDLRSARIPDRRTLSLFSLYGYSSGGGAVTTFAAEISIQVHPAGTDPLASSAGAAEAAVIHIWDAASSTWQGLPTSWDAQTGTASASSSRIGTFALTIPEHRLYLPIVSHDMH